MSRPAPCNVMVLPDTEVLPTVVVPMSRVVHPAAPPSMPLRGVVIITVFEDAELPAALIALTL